MKIYRRIEITAFRRVTIISGGSIDKKETVEDVCIDDAATSEAIETESAVLRRILFEVVRLLEEKLAGETHNSE